jgi:hypothetical protein
MNWNFRLNTIVTNKFPLDWQEHNKFTAYCVAYRTKAYDISPSFIVNNDKIDIHLVPIARECTWESKSSKHVHVLGIEEKREVTMVVYSSAT